MNTNILKKCLEELKKESPNIDYLRGMIETLVELQDVPADTVRNPINPGKPAKEPVADLPSILDAKARAAIETIKKIESESVK